MSFFFCQRVKKVRGEHVDVVGCIAAIAEDLILVTILEGGGITDLGNAVGPGDLVWSPANLWEPMVPPGLESNEEIDALYEPNPIEISA